VFLTKFKSGIIAAGLVCVCAGLFAGARHTGWLEQDSSPLGMLARAVYGPDVRREEKRLAMVREISPEIPRVTALCYHEVNPDRPQDSLNVEPEVFRRHIREFKEAGFAFIHVGDLQQCIRGRAPLPERAVLITFDDGYADNYRYAYPILRQEQVPGTFFVVSATVGKENRMTRSQLREMQAHGMEIASHTVHHENLSVMGQEELEMELRDSKMYLETLLGKPVCALAYPCGKADRAVREMAKKYYALAFLSSVAPEKKQTLYTLQRYGVFHWNEHIESIFKNR